jgi:hypothetical protein
MAVLYQNYASVGQPLLAMQRKRGVPVTSGAKRVRINWLFRLPWFTGNNTQKQNRPGIPGRFCFCRLPTSGQWRLTSFKARLKAFKSLAANN